MVVKLQAFLSSSLHDGKLSGPDLPAKKNPWNLEQEWMRNNL